MVPRFCVPLQNCHANYLDRKVSNKIGVKKIDLFDFGEDDNDDEGEEYEEDEEQDDRTA